MPGGQQRWESTDNTGFTRACVDCAMDIMEVAKGSLRIIKAVLVTKTAVGHTATLKEPMRCRVYSSHLPFHANVDADNYDACSQPCAADWPQYFVNTCQPVRAFCATLKDRSRHCAVFGQDHGSAAQPQALRPVLLERLGTYLARMASSYTKPREVSQSYLYHMCYVICTSVDVCIAHVYLHTYV